MKSVCLLSRLPDTTPVAFREYYETRHSRLGSTHFPFAKYVRNHVVAASPGVDFDVVTEFYFPDGADVGAILAGPVGEIMRKDEDAFTLRPMIRPVGVEEEVLAGPARDVAARGTRRHLLMLNAPAGAEGGFRRQVQTYGRELAESLAPLRVSVDFAAPAVMAGRGTFPFDAVLSIWPTAAAERPIDCTAPAGVHCVASVLAEVCESPPELLAQLYQPPALTS